MALLYGRAGRLTAENGGFWPGQIQDRLEAMTLEIMHASPSALQLTAAGVDELRRELRGAPTRRARSHCRFLPPRIRFIPASLR